MLKRAAVLAGLAAAGLARAVPGQSAGDPAWEVSSGHYVFPGYGTAFTHYVQNRSPNIPDNNLLTYVVHAGLLDGVIEGTAGAGSGSWQITYNDRSLVFRAVDGTYIPPAGGNTSFGFSVSHFR